MGAMLPTRGRFREIPRFIEEKCARHPRLRAIVKHEIPTERRRSHVSAFLER